MAQEKSINDNPPSTVSGHTEPMIRHGRVDCVNIYEVKDNELDLLEKGSPADNQLNFAIFFFSISLTCIGSLLTAKFDSGIAQNVFIFISVIGILGGLYLIVSWWRARTSISRIVRTIRSRIPEEFHPPVSGTAPKPVDNLKDL